MSDAVADELAIRHLVSAYADAVNRRDKALWASTWAEESVWDLSAFSAEGKANIVQLWEGAMAGFEFVAQIVHQGTLEIDGDQATGRWYLQENLKPVNSTEGRFSLGTYGDEYVKQEGRWLFSSRKYHVFYSEEGEGVTAGAVTPIP
ncbi:MAG: nuclear transport factor 2 family protein [Gammaproteobacteria bacterium]